MCQIWKLFGCNSFIENLGWKKQLVENVNYRNIKSFQKRRLTQGYKEVYLCNLPIMPVYHQAVHVHTAGDNHGAQQMHHYTFFAEEYPNNPIDEPGHHPAIFSRQVQIQTE